MIDFSTATYRNILNYMLSQVSDVYDKRDGGVIQSALGPAAYVFEGFFISLDQVQRQAFVQTATGESLDLLGVIANATRKEATKAIRLGEFNCAVPIGSRFSTINSENSINFVVLSAVTEGSYYRLQAETAGEIGNDYTGPILPITAIEGLTSAKITDILTAGEEEENDEDFRERIIELLSSKAFAGNIAAYVQEIEAMDGVGGVQVYPVWNGGGTVCCSVVDPDFLPISSDLIQTIKNAIDPDPTSGIGLGIAPIGAQVTITTPEEYPVNVTASLVMAAGYKVETIQTAAEEAIEEYLLSARKKWDVNISNTDVVYSADVYVARISAALLSIDGVVNIKSLSVNGGQVDLSLTETGELQQIPVLGEVVLTDGA